MAREWLMRGEHKGPHVLNHPVCSQRQAFIRVAHPPKSQINVWDKKSTNPYQIHTLAGTSPLLLRWETPCFQPRLPRHRVWDRGRWRWVAVRERPHLSLPWTQQLFGPAAAPSSHWTVTSRWLASLSTPSGTGVGRARRGRGQPGEHSLRLCIVAGDGSSHPTALEKYRGA